MNVNIGSGLAVYADASFLFVWLSEKPGHFQLYGKVFFADGKVKKDEFPLDSDKPDE